MLKSMTQAVRSICRYMRMSPESFDCILREIAPDISKKSTCMRETISAEERLALTLRYLASGESQQSLSYSFRIGRSTASGIISEVCEAIWNRLNKNYVTVPSTKTEWEAISEDFMNIWDLPHCIGAIDGKHIRMVAPASSGSLYYNYKGFFSIILLAVCDAQYNFTYINVGEYGSNNDSGVLANSGLADLFEENKMGVPEPKTIEGCSLDTVPYFLVGDEIFPLKTWLLRPYGGKLTIEERIFNYRLSRARRVIENCFGILVAKWRLLNQPIQADVKHIECYLLACIALHNFLRQTNCAAYCPIGFADSVDSSGNIREG